MKKLAILLFGVFAFSTAAQATFYDFVAEGDRDEQGYSNSPMVLPLQLTSGFVTGVTNGNPMPTGLTITAFSGDVPDGAIIDAYSYMDAAAGGLGVCKEIDGLGKCQPRADDGLQVMEMINIAFDDLTTEIELVLTGDHAPIGAETQFNWRTDSDSGFFDISGDYFTPHDLAFLGKTLNLTYWITDGPDGEFGHTYLASLRVVPVPAAVWLFGTAMLGLFGLRRKSKMEALAA